jgi:hypothetical protein
MYDCNIRIGRTQNGFLVTITDPALAYTFDKAAKEATK